MTRPRTIPIADLALAYELRKCLGMTYKQIAPQLGCDYRQLADSLGRVIRNGFASSSYDARLTQHSNHKELQSGRH